MRKKNHNIIFFKKKKKPKCYLEKAEILKKGGYVKNIAKI